MSISAANLISYNAANVPQNDTSTAGGAVDGKSPLAGWVADTTGAQSTEVLSNSALDTTPQVTVKARNGNDGQLKSQTAVLNGTTAVALATLGGVQIILSVSIDIITDGTTVTIRLLSGGATLHTLASGITAGTRWSRLFPNAASDAGVTLVRYDKSFWFNSDALTTLGPNYRLSADPAALIFQGIHTSKNDSITIANRLTVPGGITFVDDNIDQVGSDLLNGDSQGVWWQQTVTAGAGPLSTTANRQFTSQITVSSV